MTRLTALLAGFTSRIRSTTLGSCATGKSCLANGQYLTVRITVDTRELATSITLHDLSRKVSILEQSGWTLALVASRTPVDDDDRAFMEATAAAMRGKNARPAPGPATEQIGAKWEIGPHE